MARKPRTDQQEDIAPMETPYTRLHPEDLRQIIESMVWAVAVSGHVTSPRFNGNIFEAADRVLAQYRQRRTLIPVGLPTISPVRPTNIEEN